MANLGFEKLGTKLVGIYLELMLEINSFMKQLRKKAVLGGEQSGIYFQN